MDVPADMGLWYENGAYQLDIGNLLTLATSDSYTVRVYYASGYDDITLTGTSSPLQSPPSPSAPLFGVTYPASGEPTFTWAVPKSPSGASWSYNLQAYPYFTHSPLLEVQGLSVSFYSDPLHTDGWSLTSASTYYLWNAEAQNSSGDTISYQAIFAAHPSAPVITGIWPASVVAGTTLNINGFNLASPTNVRIGSTDLTVTVSSATQITATVPTPFNETNSYLYPVVTTDNGSFNWGLYYGAPLGNGAAVKVEGYVQDAAGTKLAEALVAMVGNPPINSATRDASKDLGSFTISLLPNNTPFSLRISKTGYQPTYTAQLTLTDNFTAPSPYPLLTYTQLNSLASGMLPGKAAVLLKVKNASEIPLADAIINVTSSSGTVYTPRYAVAPNNYTGTSGTTTDGNGMVLIPNVNHGDRLTITATKPSWAYTTMIAVGAAESLSYGEIYGWVLPPTITSFTPASAEVGAVVSIYGTNFNPDNTTKVYFNGILQNTRVVNNTSITTLVPTGVTSGPITVTTAGGTATSPTNFILLLGLSINLPGQGRGTITGSGGASFSCAASFDAKCDATAPYNSTVTLSATPDAYSSFVQWTLGATTSTNPTGFAVLMDGAKTVDANLGLLGLLKNMESEAVYLNDEANPVWRALFFATNSQPTLRAVTLGTIPLPDNGIAFNTGQSVKLLGGYTDFREATPNGYTYLTGPFTIVSGSLVLDRIVIK
ncbi:IPT/TIG domain-containing protein [Trichlorobacter lovleyi]|uniref:IPT/TIG domain-containing protein n=1 Tax=Trichlorobacter lovleyi TaxID=313985 RepID=UPI003A0FD639